ncbi:MAG: hypothetical protein K8R68_11200 [Bacteroidales bacterium]|nr:hypothetical protein [Bacteroidales bacterium]
MKRTLTITFSFIILLLFNSIIAQTNNDEDYQTAVKSADEYFNNGDYINAKASYQYASRLKPDEQYPKDKLRETINRLRDKMVVMEQFNSIVSGADRHFRLKEYEQAKQKYKEAENILPEESYPKERIAEIHEIIFAMADRQSEYDDALNKGEQFLKFKKYEKAKMEFEKASEVFPEEQYPKDRINELEILIVETEKVKEEYEQVVVSADRLFNLKYYENAKREYEKAALAKPDEDYPNSRIKEIETILLKKNEFDQLVADADELYITKDLESAKMKYQASLKIYPGESYPKGMIDKINTTLNSLKDKDELYQKSIADADGFFNSGDYTNAIKEYENAATIKSVEQYPQTKIIEINTILSKTETDRLEYSNAVKRGEQYIAEKDYFSAKDEFEKASALKPGESYPKEKLSEIGIILSEHLTQQNAYDQLIAYADQLFAEKKYNLSKDEYQKALDLRPKEKYPQERITEITAVLATKTKENKGYDDAIVEGNNLFALQQYQEAKLSFMKASNIKPKEQYPKDKIAEIDELINNQNAIRTEYNRIVGAADRMFESNEYDKSKAKYDEALALLPDEQYPKDKLTEIGEILLAQELALQEGYNNIIIEADALLSQEQHNEAIIKYREALKYKPDEEYPVKKISEIELLINDFESLKTKYSALIDEADRLFKAKEYQEAKPKYVEASAIFPDEEYPKSKIEEINLIHKANMQKIQQDYDKAIADADKFFSASVFDKALDLYRNAKAIKIDETYPDEMIGKIMKILDENAVRDLLSSSTTIEDNTQEQFTFSPVSVSDRKSNFIFIKARNISGSEFKVVLGYGKGGSKNGGFVIPITSGNDMKEFIIPIGKQYTWFSEDNDWISLTPQGGSVEVSLIKISRGK